MKTPGSAQEAPEGEGMEDAAQVPETQQGEAGEAWRAIARDPAALAAHRARLVAQADQSQNDALRQETADLLARWAKMGEAMIQAFALVPCQGDVSTAIERCTMMDADRCALRDRPSCPRNILAWQQQMDREAGRTRASMAGLPALALEAIQAGLRDTLALRTVREWVSGEGLILVLSGGPGVGKTCAAAWALWKKPGIFVKAPRLVDRSAERDSLVSQARAVPLLVVDDLGTEYLDPKGWAAGEIEGVLVDRFDQKRRTLITCNLAPEDMAARYGARVADRIQGGGRFNLIPGRSLRSE